VVSVDSFIELVAAESPRTIIRKLRKIVFSVWLIASIKL
jgi:hypothetical protein